MARTAKPLPETRDPTVVERVTRRPTHLPFSWCAECVAGRSDCPPHRRVSKHEKAMPEIVMDDDFARRDEIVTVQVMKDRYHRAVQAWVVERWTSRDGTSWLGTSLPCLFQKTTSQPPRHSWGHC